MTSKQMQMFGGDWTQKKLDMLRQYLAAYQKVMKNQSFELAYIDAFAGTGYRELNDKPDAPPLFPDLLDEEPQAFLDGSARLALHVQPPFDRYVFIERSETRFAQLKHLEVEFPEIVHRMRLQRGDCNEGLEHICKTWNWRATRAVLFLDPFGMQVDWTTVESIARTHAIDVWILFPLGIGVNRLLTRSGEIRESWRARLDRVFGTSDWYPRFYKEESTTGLFGEERRTKKVATFDGIARYYNERLRSVFAAVADNPRMLYNSRGNPLFLLCFGVANPSPKALEPALRIAQHILKPKD